MSSTTNIRGFFNGNSFPIKIDISALGLSITLSPGQYITAKGPDGTVHKINDPGFNRYVGRSRLSCEVIKDGPEVPIVSFMSRDERGQVNPFQGTDQVKTDGQGKTGPIQLPPKEKAVGPNNPIRAFKSVDEAVKAGVIHRPRIYEPAAPKETDGVPMRGERIPEITYADQDTRQPKSKLKDGLALETVVLPTEKISAPPPTAPQLTVKPVEVPVLKPVSLAEAEAQLASQKVSDSQPEGQPTEPQAGSADDYPFVCNLDNPPLRFMYRSQLASHLRRKHPAQAEAYLTANYPK